uniref:Uncharacterized protein n=1 Tax=Solanum tuberosum TaxID=4113 RepID=M1DQJ8_SOLTU
MGEPEDRQEQSACRRMAYQTVEISSVLSPEGKNQVGNEKEQSTDRRVIPRSQDRSPKVLDLEDAECQGKKAMEETKGRLAEWCDEPDLLRRMSFSSFFSATINTFLNI